MVLIFCLQIRMLRLSEGLILHVRRHEIVWKYIIWTYRGIEEAELWQSRQSSSTFTSLGMKADLKCETTDLLQSMQKGSVEAELPIFGNEGRVLVEKPIFRSLAVKTERKCRSETAIGSPGRDEMRKRNFTSLEVLAEQVRKAELQIFASKGRAEAREQNFTYLAVKAERKCGCRSGTSHFWQSMQNKSADVELQIFASQGRAEMWKPNIRSLAVKAEQKCGSGISDL